jgi:RimJ/RimL family protein N-acetyltransferase
VELDAIHHLAGWEPIDPVTFAAEVDAIAQGEEWVIDGNYRTVVVDGPVWQRADTVVWLDLPRRTVMRQVISRTDRRSVRREELWNGNREPLRNLYAWDPHKSIIRWAWTQHAKSGNGTVPPWRLLPSPTSRSCTSRATERANVGSAVCFADAMTDVRASRLSLHPIGVAEAERIVARSAGPADDWADDFPFEGDVGAVESFLRATAAFGEQRPFGYYRITRLSDGRAVGGIGFKGRPDGGCVEIGYSLAPSARGHGYAAEALIALLSVAADHGLSRVIADTTLDNIASQRTLVRAGFRLVSTEADLYRYEVVLNGGPVGL